MVKELLAVLLCMPVGLDGWLGQYVFQNYLGNYYLEYIAFLNFQQYMIHLFMVEARMEYRAHPKNSVFVPGRRAANGIQCSCRVDVLLIVIGNYWHRLFCIKCLLIQKMIMHFKKCSLNQKNVREFQKLIHTFPKKCSSILEIFDDSIKLFTQFFFKNVCK
jgi:hypothetical protein